MLLNCFQRFGAAPGYNLCVENGSEGSEPGSDSDMDYKCFLFAAANAVVEADSTVNSKGGRCES